MKTRLLASTLMIILLTGLNVGPVAAEEPAVVIK